MQYASFAGAHSAAPQPRTARAPLLAAQGPAQGLAFLLTVCFPLVSLLVSLVLACLVAWYIHDDPVTPPARRRGQDHQ